MPGWTTEWKYPSEKMPQAAFQSYQRWFTDISHRGQHPKEAAESNGDMHYEKLNGYKTETYSVRLSQKHRVVFEMDKAKMKVTIVQVGGHY